MRHFRDARAIEEFLIEQMSAQGYLTQEVGGDLVVRVINITDDGRKVPDRINLSQIARELEKKLS
ncbi:hypothetical protein [Pararhizobium sp.]|uniref:hypothetical protein n=1 Tax=Pararhizobium sp. TaxID=1977563 RepID=UPI003D10F4AF